MKVEMVDHTPQLTRIIQINSGKADYIEIEPRNSTHLAADNGEGKSSILNALQFLMIDDWSRMKFPKGNDETAAFYFPGENSHLIFEIRDELNHHHQVWFSGRTSAVKDRYQRIVLNGKYSKSLFIEEKENRWHVFGYNEVLANCSARGIDIQPFKNSTDLRSYLSEKINWYPVSPTFQKRFFTVMKKLNELSDMTPNDLKEVLIEVAQIKSTTLDFEVEYRGSWSRLEHEGKVIDELRKKQNELEKLGKNLEREREMQSHLIDNIQLIGKAMNAKEEGVISETIEINRNIEELGNELEVINESLSDNKSRRREIDREIGSLQNDLRELKILKKWADEVTEKDLTHAKNQAYAEFRDLSDRLEMHKQHSESTVSLNEINKTIARYELEIRQYSSKLEGTENSIYSKLSELGIEPDSLFWTKFNPDLLMSPGEITSKSELNNEIKTLHASNDLILPGIRTQIQVVTNLENYTNPEVVRRKLEQAEENLNKSLQLKKDLENFEQLSEDYENADMRVKKAITELQKYEQWNSTGKSELDENELKLATFENSLSQLDKDQTDLEQKSNHVTKSLEQFESMLLTYNNEVESCVTEWEDELSKYLGGKIPTETAQFSLEKLKIDIRNCKDRISDLERVQRDILELRMNLGQLAVFLALDPSSEEFVVKALERYQTIDVDEDNLTTAWMNLQGSIVQKANLLREGIVAVRRELNSINARFKKTNVSNLELFEVKLIDNSTELKMFDSLSQLGGFAKFTRTEKEMEALETFKNEISKRNKFYLSRLFDLQFVIKNPGEELKEIKRLDFVGSTGTQTVVKTVLLFLLLSKFTKSKRKITKIPVQLDEVGTLGSSNYSEILDVANALNFQIFTASPKSVAAADIVYPLLKGSREGRLFCDISTGRPKPKKKIAEEE